MRDSSNIKLCGYPIPTGSYLRVIRGVGKERKALYGIPCLNKKFIGDGCDRVCNITIRQSSMGGKKTRKRKTSRRKKRRKQRKKTRKKRKRRTHKKKRKSRRRRR